MKKMYEFLKSCMYIISFNQMVCSSKIARLRFLASARLSNEKVSVVTSLGMGSDWLDLSVESVSCCTRCERA